MIPAGPLRSAGVTPHHRYYGPIRLPIRPTSTVMDSRRADRARPRPVGPLRFPDSSVRTRRPLRPRRARRLHLSAASRPVIGFITFDSLATLNGVTRLNWVHLSLRLARSPVRVLHDHRLPGAHARPATCQADHCMMDSFHSTRQTKFPDAPKIAKKDEEMLTGRFGHLLCFLRDLLLNKHHASESLRQFL